MLPIIPAGPYVDQISRTAVTSGGADRGEEALHLLAPVAWLIGIPWAEARAAGGLLGTKIVLNEFIAYVDFAALPDQTFGARSRLIVTYALCGFANFGSLGIMIGGLGVMVPERRGEIVALGLKTIVSGNIATFLTAAVVGLL